MNGVTVIMRFLLIPLIVIAPVISQTSVTRVCSLQVVLDNLLWMQQRDKIAINGANITGVELDRITRWQS